MTSNLHHHWTACLTCKNLLKTTVARQFRLQNFLYFPPSTEKSQNIDEYRDDSVACRNKNFAAVGEETQLDASYAHTHLSPPCGGGVVSEILNLFWRFVGQFYIVFGLPEVLLINSLAVICKPSSPDSY